jgi:hypothetical protein
MIACPSPVPSRLPQDRATNARRLAGRKIATSHTCSSTATKRRLGILSLGVLRVAGAVAVTLATLGRCVGESCEEGGIIPVVDHRTVQTYLEKWAQFEYGPMSTPPRLYRFEHLVQNEVYDVPLSMTANASRTRSITFLPTDDYPSYQIHDLMTGDFFLWTSGSGSCSGEYHFEYLYPWTIEESCTDWTCYSRHCVAVDDYVYYNQSDFQTTVTYPSNTEKHIESIDAIGASTASITQVWTLSDEYTTEELIQNAILQVLAIEYPAGWSPLGAAKTVLGALPYPDDAWYDAAT